MMAKYFNPYTDFGFKKLFGEEASKDLLMDFLNQLLPDYHQIANLSFKNPEKIANTPKEKKAIFDIYCQTAKGERFIVEMQKAKVNFLKTALYFIQRFRLKSKRKKANGILN
jgi:predicted transposase/invertase (TIGR01784 family)